ncbi:hypothetical protein [Salinispora arenicola]|uniref:hypothetical protein n=1 Tax=Salinispora arenicola TaxID=168697 RepID=UPI0027DD9E59|nr:hypothetical protein [Salinispora arenicola]
MTDLALAGVAGAFLLADSPRWIWLVYPLTFLSAVTSSPSSRPQRLDAESRRTG